MAEQTGRWRFGIRWLGLVLSLCVVYWLVDLRVVWRMTKQVSWWTSLIGLALIALRNALVALRWRVMNTQEEKPPYRRYALYVFASIPMVLISPGTLGFDVARGAMLGKEVEENQARHVISVLSDRIVGFFSVILFGNLALWVAPTFPSREKYFVPLLLLLLGFVAGLLVATSGVLYRLLQRIFGALGGVGQRLLGVLELWMEIAAFFRANLGRVLVALALCFVIHMAWFLLAYLIAQEMGLHLSFFVIATVTALSWVVLMLPITVMGLGVNELSFVFLLSFQGIPAESATALSLHMFALLLVMAILCIPLLWFLPLRAAAQEAGEA